MQGKEKKYLPQEAFTKRIMLQGINDIFWPQIRLRLSVEQRHLDL